MAYLAHTSLLLKAPHPIAVKYTLVLYFYSFFKCRICPTVITESKADSKTKRANYSKSSGFTL
jgi:hypothetical protein